MLFIIVQVLAVATISTAYVAPQTVKLNDGNSMPIISYGTVGKTDIMDVVIRPSVVEAIRAGYRQFDTAAIYRNEEYVGQGIADAISLGLVKREDIFITTKLHPSIVTREGVLEGIQGSLRRLQVDYIDLYLIHVPFNLFNVSGHDIPTIWRGMEDVKRLNLTRSIGVSNFEVSHMEQLLAANLSLPSTNEIEINPTITQLDIVKYCQEKNVAVLAYAPFGFMVERPFAEGPITTFEEPILRRLAQKYGKFPSQITLRYLMDRGTVPIPRSTNTIHIHNNINIFDFKLTQEEIDEISELNQNVKVYNFDPEPLQAMLDYYDIIY